MKLVEYATIRDNLRDRQEEIQVVRQVASHHSGHEWQRRALERVLRKLEIAYELDVKAIGKIDQDQDLKVRA